MLQTLQALYNSCLFYGAVLLLPYSPGVLAWKLFRHKKGKLPLIKRDLLCDTATLMSLPKNDSSLDEFTNAFSPFVPILTLNGKHWQDRRKILAFALRKMNRPFTFSMSLPEKRGDIYWDIFEKLFTIGFELIFGRPMDAKDFSEMYSGIVDMNKMIKRQAGVANTDLRWKLYHHVVHLLAQNDDRFVFAGHQEFASLPEIDQVSIVVEDLLTSICIQCTDLICHLILEYSEHETSFKNNLDDCINETLRLYPLTDIWTRKATETERGWIASLVQLNRSGWDKPDSFIAERWDASKVDNSHPPLISWGFDSRGCPATKLGYNLVKYLFETMVLQSDVWIEPASNYTHDRTFSLGCQVCVGKGVKPKNCSWKFTGKWQNLIKQWFSTRYRVFDQKELW